MTDKERPKKTHTILVRVEEDVYNAIKKISYDSRIPISQIVRDALYSSVLPKKE